MIDDLLRSETGSDRDAARPSARAGAGSTPAQRRRARLGPLSLWLLALAVVLQTVSLVQQLSYLFAPREGELPLVLTTVILASLVGCAGVVSGALAATTTDGRRTGIFGVALGLALLVLFAAASSFGWGFLQALSAPA
ncbi:hypothetical protein AA0Z99_00475 [Agrococcus sp. 1P02AA]|uniref:hypothetical protein n=1 Tax=Agrococcus sp. 1P02AA TaxID=3132259 RepID=UPI0039A65408